MFDAVYHDGKSAKAHRVRIGLGQKNLHILLTDQSKTLWARDDVTIVQNPEPQQALILAERTVRDARVVIDDETAKEFLFAAFKGKRSFTDPKRFLQILTAAVFLGVGFVTLWARLSPRLADHIPFAWEKSIGETMLDDMKQNMPVCVEPNGLKALNDVQTRLQRGAALSHPLRLVVLDGDDYNAMSVPGNIIMVMSMIVKQATSVDEIAGVIAHEMGHEIEHHPMRDAVRSLGLRVFIGLTLGSAGDLKVAGLVNTLGELSYTRDQERQADVWAAHLMNAGGYDIGKLNDFFKRLPQNEMENSRLITLLSSHPATRERMDFLNYSAAQQKKTAPDAQAAATLKALKNICSKTEK